ncbi:MAG: helix-turn-helix domain-containing protein [Limisphaerales bacterium]
MSDELTIADLKRIGFSHQATVLDRLGKVLVYQALQAAGRSYKGAADLMDLPNATLCRWRKQFERDGIIGLCPRHDLCGRRKKDASV